MTFKVPVGISNHHVHLTKETYQILFKTSFQKVKDLTQTNEFATDKMVTLIGPKGTVEHVRVLGPFRNYNQVEITKTDAYHLGINPPVRKSGNLSHSETITLKGEDGTVTLSNACILAECHIHMNEKDLQKYHVEDNELVMVYVNQQRKGVFLAHIKASENGVLDFHIDRDEANAFLLNGNETLEVHTIKQQRNKL